MSPKEAWEAMLEIKSLAESDPEAAHAQADCLLCELLREHSYHDCVEAFEAMTKWYG